MADRTSDDLANQEDVPIAPPPPKGDDLAGEQRVPATPPPAKSDHPSDQEAVSVAPPPTEGDGHGTTDDGDAPRSEMGSAEDRVSSTQWAINLIALASKSKTEKLQRDYAAKGVEAELIRNGRLFALRIPGFADRGEAVAYAESVKQKLGIGDVWIYEY